ASYACFTSSNVTQCSGFVVLAANPDGWTGRFVHFAPVQIGTQSTQFFRCLSSGGIRSNLGRMKFGGVGTSVLASGSASALDFFTCRSLMAAEPPTVRGHS